MHHELTREQAREAFAKGLAHEKDSRQLELRTRYELNRAERARKRLEKIRAITRERETREKAARERTERQREVRTVPTRAERERVIQQAKERAVREWMDEWNAALGLEPREQQPEQTGQQEREREEREKARAKELEAAGNAAHRRRLEAAARLAEDRERHREAAERGQYSPATAREIVDLLAVGPATPIEQERRRDAPTPQITRDRGERGRERVQERDRW
ncbi:hypothetical protein [Nocardia sp. BMG51109]|uniref:hypothetical protein n=1 Tax=Nocardia sp. BMG51109 TaxID=1056816 RepID=UPI0018DE19B1|nr:hypothetical protein [Nocardia sp. BMG51109]